MHEPTSSPLWGHQGQACGEGVRFALSMLLTLLYKVALA
ncbi:hypothetical protein FICEBENF_01273 [Aeromonas hydrophila]